MTLKQDQFRLRQLIETAFAAVPYPGDEDLIEHHCPECEDFSRHFRGKRWMDFKDDPLALLGVRYQEAFAFFTPRAFRYYLPLGMLAVVGLYEHADLLPQSLVLHLSPTPHNRGWHEARLSLLSMPQLHAVGSFLVFLQSCYGHDLGNTTLSQITSALDDIGSRLSSSP
jgi:hypothetical protein